jgi:hypothetical protein
MRRHFISAILIVAASGIVAAQSGGAYNRANEQAISGTVKTVVSFQAPDGSVGVHFDLKTDDGKIVSVHVGPAVYVGMQNFFFFADDKVEIIGTRTTYDGNVFITAKSIQKGSEILVLRDDTGKPKWSGDLGIDGCGVNHIPVPSNTER